MSEARRQSDEMIIELVKIQSEMHSDIKHLVKTVDDHMKDDTNRFKTIGDQLQTLNRFMWMGLGALMILELYLKLTK